MKLQLTALALLVIFAIANCNPAVDGKKKLVDKFVAEILPTMPESKHMSWSKVTGYSIPVCAPPPPVLRIRYSLVPKTFGFLLPKDCYADVTCEYFKKSYSFFLKILNNFSSIFSGPNQL